MLEREVCPRVMGRRAYPHRLDITSAGPLPYAQMIAAGVTVQALLPVHVRRFAIQKKSSHRSLCVAAVVQKRIEIAEECSSSEGIAGAPPRLLKRRLNLLARAHKHQ